MEELHQIIYDGKVYKVYEPTIDVWSALMTEQSWSSDFDLGITLISWITGLTEEEVREASASSIINAAEGIIEYYTNQTKNFYENFEFNNKTYKFIDIPNLTFGEFVDIDEFLQKTESEKNKRLHELMSLLYREIDDKGNYLPYDIQRIKETAEEFRKLPIKYLNGALVFFSIIETISQRNIQLYFYQRDWWKLQLRMLKRRTLIRSVGIPQLISWLKTIYLIFQKWFKLITSKHSISLLTKRIKLNAKNKN